VATRTITIGQASLPRLASVPRPLRIAALAVGCLALEAVLAASIADARFSRFLLLFVAAGAIAFVFRFPMFTALALFGLTDFVFHPSFFPSFGLGPVNARTYELVLVALFAVALVRPERRTWGGMVGAALALLLTAVVVSGLISVSSGESELTDVFNWARSMGLLAVFWVVVRLFPEPAQRRVLLTGAAIIAAVGGVIALLIALGWSGGETLAGAGDQIVRTEEGVGSVERVRLPALSAAYVLFWFVIVRVMAGRSWQRVGWTAILLGLTLSIVVSFNRNMWSGLAIGMVLMMVLGGTMLRSRFAIAIAVVVAGVAFISAAAPDQQDRLIDPVIKRGATILNPQAVSRESSYRDREVETTLAWTTAKANLWIGVGAGAPFGVWLEQRIGQNSYVRMPQLFLHNQYLYLLLIGGIPALLGMLGFLGGAVALAVRRRPRDLSVTACGVGIVMVMISAAVAIYFSVEDMTVMLGVLAGVIVADADGPAAAGLDSGLAQ
jgi:O-antigen ligase